MGDGGQVEPRGAGLDLVGRFLWQPEERGGREGFAQRGDTHRGHSRRGRVALLQRGPLLELGWEAATQTKEG